MNVLQPRSQSFFPTVAYLTVWYSLLDFIRDLAINADCFRRSLKCVRQISSGNVSLRAGNVPMKLKTYLFDRHQRIRDSQFLTTMR